MASQRTKREFSGNVTIIGMGLSADENALLGSRGGEQLAWTGMTNAVLPNDSKNAIILLELAYLCCFLRCTINR